MKTIYCVSFPEDGPEIAFNSFEGAVAYAGKEYLNYVSNLRRANPGQYALRYNDYKIIENMKSLISDGFIKDFVIIDGIKYDDGEE